MNGIKWILFKDLQRFTADRLGAFLTVLVPVVLASLLGSIFGPQITSSSRSLDLVIVNHDEGPLGAALVHALERKPDVDVIELSESDARQRLAEGDLSIVVLIPPDLSNRLTKTRLLTGGDPARGMLLFDPTHTVKADLAQGVITQTLIEDVLFEGQRNALPILLDRQEVGNDNSGFNVYAHSFAGMLCMFLLFFGMEQGRALHNERSQGSLLRLRMSQIPQSIILLGTACSTALVSLAISASIYVAGALLFDIQVLGSPLGFALIILAISVFTGGFALFLAGVARSERQLVNMGTFLILLLSFAGGAWIPSFIMPEWVLDAAAFLPTQWATEGLASATWRGAGLGAIAVPTALLLGAGTVAAWIGIRCFRWEATSR